MNRSSQSGNAVIMIMVAVALFAAIGFALMQGSRSSTAMISDQQASAYASQILATGNEIKNAIKRLQLRGCTETQISFDYGSGTSGYENSDAPSDESCHVFSIKGGGLQFPAAMPALLQPLTASSGVNYKFIGRSAVQDVGTSAGELYLWLRTRSRETCLKYNNLVGVANPSETDAPTDIGFYDSPLFSGSYTSGTTVTGGGALNGKLTGCHKDSNETDSDGANYYDFYMVLIAR